MKRIFIILLILSLGLVVGVGRAEASGNPFSMQTEDWQVEFVNRRAESTNIFALGKTDMQLDAANIETWTKKSATGNWYKVNTDRVVYIANVDSVMASILVDNTFFTKNFQIMLKYEGDESPPLNFCYYAASTVISEICTNPFEQAGEDNSLEELPNEKIRLIAALSRTDIDRDEVKLYVNQNVGNPKMVDVAIGFAPGIVSAFFDPGITVLNKTYFFEFGDYKSPDFLLKGMALMTLRPMEAAIFMGEEAVTEEGGSVGGSQTEVEVSEDADSALSEASAKASGHCSLMTDTTVTGMGVLITLFCAMLAPLTLARIRRKG